LISRNWTRNGSEYRIRSTAESHENDKSGTGRAVLEYKSEYGWINLDPMDCPDLLFLRLSEILDEQQV
jgi:hypothetical protein